VLVVSGARHLEHRGSRGAAQHGAFGRRDRGDLDGFVGLRDLDTELCRQRAVHRRQLGAQNSGELGTQVHLLQRQRLAVGVAQPQQRDHRLGVADVEGGPDLRVRPHEGRPDHRGAVLKALLVQDLRDALHRVEAAQDAAAAAVRLCGLR
jgi:hypothetical protein